jgi:hypothetical protein
VRFAYTSIKPTIPLRPYLTVFLRNGSRTTDTVMAVVDSGADYCIFPDDLAFQLGLDLAQAQPWFVYGISGVRQPARVAGVSLGIIGTDQNRALDEIQINCVFCTNFEFGSPLLGQNGFFSNFLTTFHQRKYRFDITPYRSLRRRK